MAKLPKNVKLLTAVVPKPRTVYFWWTASDAYRVSLVGWKKMKWYENEETNRMGAGAVVYSDWLFNQCNKKQRSGLPKGYYLLRPYTALYISSPWGKSNPRKVKRPTLSELSA